MQKTTEEIEHSKFQVNSMQKILFHLSGVSEIVNSEKKTNLDDSVVIENKAKKRLNDTFSMENI